MIKNTRISAVLALFSLIFIIFLSGCGAPHASKKKKDGPPKYIPMDLLKTPDAVPRLEPLSRYGNRFNKGKTNTYVALKRRYKVMPSSHGYRVRGIASWYGTQFHGRKTSNGERYNMFAMTAAHPHLPLPCYVQVTNLDNGKSVVVRVNDRGPFHKNRVIDLSYVAAAKLGILAKGTGRVEIVSIDPRDHGGKIPNHAKRRFQSKVRPLSIPKKATKTRVASTRVPKTFGRTTQPIIVERKSHSSKK